VQRSIDIMNKIRETAMKRYDEGFKKKSGEVG
jgi:hypothetical protein